MTLFYRGGQSEVGEPDAFTLDCSHDHVERDDDGLDRVFYRCLDCEAEVSPVNDPDGPYWVTRDE